MTNTPPPLLEPVSDEGVLVIKTEARNESHRLWWQIAILLFVCALLVYSGTAFDDELKKFFPESRQLASTFNNKASGLMALHKLAKTQGNKTERWEVPYRLLEKEKGMLVLIAPTESLQPFQIDQILSWVKRGNDLVYIDDFSFDLTSSVIAKLGLKSRLTDSSFGKSQEVEVKPEASFPESSHVSKLRMASSVRILGGTPLAQDSSGAFLTVVKHGEGRVLVGTCPALLSNKTIGKKEYWGNFQLIANWFRTADGTILFDEYAHGYSGGTNVFVYLSRGPVGLAVLQIVLILAIAIASEWQRFGAATKIDERRKISNLEFISGLSNAYRRAKANSAVLEILFHAFRIKLSKVLAVSPHEPVDRLKEAWSQSDQQSTQNLALLIDQYEDYMARRNVSDTELKTMIATCDKITDATKDSLTSNPIARLGS